MEKDKWGNLEINCDNIDAKSDCCGKSWGDLLGERNFKFFPIPICNFQDKTNESRKIRNYY